MTDTTRRTHPLYRYQRPVTSAAPIRGGPKIPKEKGPVQRALAPSFGAGGLIETLFYGLAAGARRTGPEVLAVGEERQVLEKLWCDILQCGLFPGLEGRRAEAVT